MMKIYVCDSTVNTAVKLYRPIKFYVIRAAMLFVCFFFSASLCTVPSTYHSPLLQVGSAKRNDTILPGAESKGQPLSWKQTGRQWGHVQVPVRSQGTYLWVCRKEEEGGGGEGKRKYTVLNGGKKRNKTDE